VVKELLQSDYKTLAVYTTDEQVLPFENAQPLLTVITDIQLSKISNLETPNKVLAVAEIPEQNFSFDAVASKLSLALDTINDPGNLGTIIRTAAWFGIETIICSATTADAWNAKAVQASMGALFRVKVVYADLEKVVADYTKNDIPVYATTLDGDNIYTSELAANGLIIIGSESHGVSKELLSLIDKKLLIPSFAAGNAESLNAAVAAGVVCSEFRRRGYFN